VGGTSLREVDNTGINPKRGLGKSKVPKAFKKNVHGTQSPALQKKGQKRLSGKKKSIPARRSEWGVDADTLEVIIFGKQTKPEGAKLMADQLERIHT